MDRVGWPRLAALLVALTLIAPAAAAGPPDIVREDWYLRESLSAIRDWEEILAHWQKTLPEAERTPKLPVPNNGQAVVWPNPIPTSLLPARDRNLAVEVRGARSADEIVVLDRGRVAAPERTFSPVKTLIP